MFDGKGKSWKLRCNTIYSIIHNPLYKLVLKASLFLALPVNQTAKDYFVEPYVLTEENWIHFQHHLRGLAQDEELKCVLESIKKYGTQDRKLRAQKVAILTLREKKSV